MGRHRERNGRQTAEVKKANSLELNLARKIGSGIGFHQLIANLKVWDRRMHVDNLPSRPRIDRLEEVLEQRIAQVYPLGITLQPHANCAR